MPTIGQCDDDTADEDNDRNKRIDMGILKSHAAQLAEHFDSVLIIATKYRPAGGGTSHSSYGEGDWYARYGAARAWLKNEDAKFSNMGD
jgi:hypothetical protein